MTKNIVLIGMPGAGKTTIGIALSYKLKMSFMDVDEFIEKKYGMTVLQIFENHGEKYFRELEAETVKYLSENYKNTIISTGGGVVLNPINMENLKKTGTIVYINRSADKILTNLESEKRPLLKENPQKIYDMYKEREPLYLKYADICVANSGKFNDCINDIKYAIKNRM